MKSNTDPQANVLWTAPASATVTISGSIWTVRNLNRPQQWKLYKNSTVLTQGTLSASQGRANPCNLAAGLGAVAVNANDTIQLEVSGTTINVGDLVGVNLTITATTPPPNPDADADQLPDAWEMQYFGNLAQNGSGDFDGDGLTNLQEYQAGTNPTHPDSDGDGLPDAVDAYPAIADTLAPTFTTSSPVRAFSTASSSRARLSAPRARWRRSPKTTFS